MCFLWENEFSFFSPFSACDKGCTTPAFQCHCRIFFLIHNIPPTSFHTSQGASDHCYTTAASSHAVSFILHCLPGCEGILKTPTASECSRTGRASGRVHFQLSVLKRLTDVRRISCLWTSTSSVPSFSKHKQWVGRSEICSEPGCQNRNIFLKDKCQKKKKKEGVHAVYRKMYLNSWDFLFLTLWAPIWHVIPLCLQWFSCLNVNKGILGPGSLICWWMDLPHLQGVWTTS